MSNVNDATLVPFTLQDAPALIETVFPAQKVSFEAQRERKANLGQTLTGLGSYWKGRKPLILVRAIILGSLLPVTSDAEQDLELFEALMAFDIPGLGRRAVAQAALKPMQIAQMIPLANPWDYFSYSIAKGNVLLESDVQNWQFPVDAQEQGVRLSWKRGISDETKADIYARALANVDTYEERSLLCKRPEEVDESFLLTPVWARVNQHLGHLGVSARSMSELIEQLGILRYGHRPKVGDTFAGGGSIPFEAARMGCDVYASDLNPVACMLNWGNFNIIGASAQRRAEIEQAQRDVATAVNAEIRALGIEHDDHGNRAKAYLYCLEVRCPESGWMIPLAPSWVISKSRNVIAKLIPNNVEKSFDIEVLTGVSEEEMLEAVRGSVRDGSMVYELDGKSYSTPIRTLRGDYRNPEGVNTNRLRRWEKSDFKPRPDDIFQERLYAVQWITKDTLEASRQTTFFASVTASDLERERTVETLVEKSLASWQEQGLVPDMAIEPGEETTRLQRERGWTYWHHLFNARQLLLLSSIMNRMRSSNHASALMPFFCRSLDANSKLCRWDSAVGQDRVANTFSNQALNTLYNYPTRAFEHIKSQILYEVNKAWNNVGHAHHILQRSAVETTFVSDLWITDPPYADAVNYHEITEFFIAWMRKNPPAPFSEWIWDSRRVLAIKGDGDDFRRAMIDAYSAMANHMPDNGMQCVMFTHQSSDVWSDMVGIFWAAGLQVVAAWYIATETSSELKKGGYVQGTVTLMLRKRPAGDRPGFKQRILPAVRVEVEQQIKQMMHLNDETRSRMGEPVFNDADLQMAGYAAALKVLTGYTKIGDTDVTDFALRPRIKGEVTVVDEIVQQASEAANSLLVPEGLSQDAWHAINGIQRFYLRMLDMESVGASKLDNYQNFAKAFRVQDYSKVMASMAANKSALTPVHAFAPRDLTDSTEIGPTWLGHLIVAIQQIIQETDLNVVIQQLMEDMPDFLDIRPRLIDLARFLASKCQDKDTREAADILASRMQNLRALGQD